jgi:hypothetical protein
MPRKLLVLCLCTLLCWTTLSCGAPTTSNLPQQNSPSPTGQPTQSQGSVQQPSLPAGQYPVQQATYNDADGEYTVLLLNTPAGVPSSYRSPNLPLARLTDAEIAAGQKSYLKVEQGQPSLHLTEDFKIEYVHNVTENVTNPQTGRTETVIVRQEPSFWSPFAGALAGQALGSLLFRPQYYLPPVYQPGGTLTGFGGYGSSYGQAVERYQQRYQAPPAAIRNRKVFRSTGQLNSPGYNNPNVRRPPNTGGRPPGSGYGSTTLRRSNRPYDNTRGTRSFGSGGRSRSTGRRR